MEVEAWTDDGCMLLSYDAGKCMNIADVRLGIDIVLRWMREDDPDGDWPESVDDLHLCAGDDHPYWLSADNHSLDHMIEHAWLAEKRGEDIAKAAEFCGVCFEDAMNAIVLDEDAVADWPSGVGRPHPLPNGTYVDFT